tara:strand:- start:8937 stop:10019 length:1083 start_codon:yes stop_codon:yes gene_type:complete
MPFDRTFETVEINISNLNLKNNDLVVFDDKKRKNISSQLVDNNFDGEMDVLLFQPEVASKSKILFKIKYSNKEQKIENYCYSRFVPERTDDYAWENNLVAFRTFGPTAQNMVEQNIKGGTLTSGIDAWLKRVEYPIINKWYKEHLSGESSYHDDNGEGLDNFHVGKSRGIGGIAVKTKNSYAVSKNFIRWKTITNGPIRTSFELTYDDWEADEKIISEKKIISLDYGNNLSKFIVKLKGSKNILAGIALHNNEGEITETPKNGWVSYWEPHDDSSLGMGIVANIKNIIGVDKYISNEKDKSNLFLEINGNNSIYNYYAGFGWKKSGQFESISDWNNYLEHFSKCLKNPLQVSIIEQNKEL